MKTLALLLTLAMLSGCSRKRYNDLPRGPGLSARFDLRRAALAGSIAAVSGASWGLHETAVHHPSRLPAGWNRQWWDARVSWTNKYRRADPAAGPAYLGSTTFLAWTTDAKHLFGTAHRATLFGAALVIGLGERRPAWHYLLDAGISFVAFSAGFHGVYSIAFQP